MKRFFPISFFLFFLLGTGCAKLTAPVAEIPTPFPPSSVLIQEVSTDAVRGQYILPSERTGKLPGILVIHEWWGLNDQIKEEAKKLAAEGYAVFAVDLYDGEVAADAKRAGELAGGVRQNPEAAVRKMKAALDYLAAQQEVESEKLASLGWCFGGGQSALVGTTADPRLKATVIYYGTPITDVTALAEMKQPVLGIWGETDQSIPVASVRSFEEALKKQQTPVEFHYYPDAGHAFANPTRGDAYRPEAATDAWQKTLDFLSRTLKR